MILAARMIAQAGEAPVDLWPFLHLAGDDRERADDARFGIAQQYYSAQARAKKGSNP